MNSRALSPEPTSNALRTHSEGRTKDEAGRERSAVSRQRSAPDRSFNFQPSTFNPVAMPAAFTAIRGRIGDRVYKTYAGGKLVVTRVPRFDGYVPTPAQRARRNRLREATAYAKRVYADPLAKAIYATAAKKLGRQPFRLAISDYLGATTRDAINRLGVFTGARRESRGRGFVWPLTSAPRSPRLRVRKSGQTVAHAETRRTRREDTLTWPLLPLRPPVKSFRQLPRSWFGDYIPDALRKPIAINGFRE